MAIEEAKVYFDGSHYIAIPYIPNPRRKRPKPPDELISVAADEDTNTQRPDETEAVEPPTAMPEREKPPVKQRQMTRKELFEELYAKTVDMKKAERRKYILGQMHSYFPDKEAAEEYVHSQLDRKKRNLICRRVRLVRKVNLQEFNYFCTFTYDDKKHTEDTFKTKLRDCFKKMCYRRGWKYVGVWERSPEKKRLHFHGLFYIPEGGLPGELIRVNDYSPVKKKVQHTIQSTYFNERFGRSDFKPIAGNAMLGQAMAYLTKYLEKTGEKIVYSKGLPQYFISDILDNDVVCPMGQEDRKLLLFDNFSCFDQGVYVGQVSPEVIAQLRKSN